MAGQFIEQSSELDGLPQKLAVLPEVQVTNALLAPVMPATTVKQHDGNPCEDFPTEVFEDLSSIGVYYPRDLVPHSMRYTDQAFQTVINTPQIGRQAEVTITSINDMQIAIKVDFGDDGAIPFLVENQS